MDPATAAAGGAVGKAWWRRVLELAKHGQKIAALVREVTTLREDVAALKTQVADLQRHAVPADPEIDATLGVWTGVVGGTRHNFCPVCWGRGEHQVLQHEPDKQPPWRCPACGACFPGGYRGRSGPRVSEVRRDWMAR